MHKLILDGDFKVYLNTREKNFSLKKSMLFV